MGLCWPPTKLLARDIVVIDNLASSIEGQTLTQLIQSKVGIPKKFIKLINGASECSKKSDAILQVCLLKNGEIEIIKKNDDVLENLKSSFFMAGDKNNETF
jgi:hypothetical protein